MEENVKYFESLIRKRGGNGDRQQNVVVNQKESETPGKEPENVEGTERESVVAATEVANPLHFAPMEIQTSEVFKFDGEGGVEEMKGEEKVERRHVRTGSVDVPVKRAPVIEEMTLNEASPFLQMTAAVLSSEKPAAWADLALLTARLYRCIVFTVNKDMFAQNNIATRVQTQQSLPDQYLTPDEKFSLKITQDTLIYLDAVPLACELIRQVEFPELQLEGMRLANFLLMDLNKSAQEKFIEVIEGKDCNHPTAGEGLIDAVSAFVLNFKAAVSALRGEERIHELWKAKIALKFLQSLCGKSAKSAYNQYLGRIIQMGNLDQHRILCAARLLVKGRTRALTCSN
jgi:hypothetical protein